MLCSKPRGDVVDAFVSGNPSCWYNTGLEGRVNAGSMRQHARAASKKLKGDFESTILPQKAKESIIGIEDTR